MNVKILYLLFTVLMSFPIGSYSPYYQNLPVVFQTEWVISNKPSKQKTFNFSDFSKQKRQCNSFCSNYNSNYLLGVLNIETEINIKIQKEIFEKIKDTIGKRAIKYCSNNREEYVINV